MRDEDCTYLCVYKDKDLECSHAPIRALAFIYPLKASQPPNVTHLKKLSAAGKITLLPEHEAIQSAAVDDLKQPHIPYLGLNTSLQYFCVFKETTFLTAGPHHLPGRVTWLRVILSHSGERQAAELSV